MMRWQTTGLGILVGIGLAGCPGSDDKDQSATPAPEIGHTAWWKQPEGAATTPAATAPTTLTGEPMAGWQQLPPVDAALAKRGADLFLAKGCTACHSIGKGTVVVGPDLLGITHRVEPDWLKGWLKAPDVYLEKDAYAKGLLAKYLVKMPNLNLDDDTIQALVENFRQHDAAATKK
jgi:cytochrome c551/c552